MEVRSRGRKPSPRRLLIATTAVIALAVAAAPVGASAADAVVMAAGDIACASPGISTPGDCSHVYTSDLALDQQASPEGLAALLALGDLQYPDGELADFQSFFDPSWGRLSSVLRPVPGNHEYNTSGAAGYFDYFASLGVGVGARGEGWYSFDLGNWHLIALNSSNGCTPVSCAVGSAQETWLRSNLAATTKPCILAYWHHPLASDRQRPIWQDLYDAGVDIVLAGHAHRYVKPVARDPSGAPNPNGPREFIVGTGGVDPGDSGLLKLTLHANSVNWVFVGSGASDSGSATCRSGAPPPPPPPPPPAKPTPDFQASPTGLSVDFEDLSTGSPTSWLWSFGDGATSTAQSTTHTYAQAGTYTVTLTARNSGGSADKSRNVTLQAPASAAPPPAIATDPIPSQQILAQSVSPPTPLKLKLKARRASFRLLRSGLPIEVSGPTGLPLRLTVTASRATARAAHLSLHTLAARVLAKPGVAHLRVPKALRDALRRARGRLTITVTVRAEGLSSVAETYTLRG